MIGDLDEADEQRPGPQPGVWRALAWLRYLLVVPALVAYQRRVRRSLRWRLAESHVATVFLSVLAIAILGGAALVLYALIHDPVQREPATEARIVAGMIEDLGWASEPALRAPRTSALLGAIATGQVGPNLLREDVNLVADIGQRFAHIRTISIVGQDHAVTASSEPSLVGQNAIRIGPAALGVARLALDGQSDTARNSILQRPGNTLVTGAYPIWGTVGGQRVVVAAAVVDKTRRTLPSGWRLVGVALDYVGQIGLTIVVWP